MRKSDSVSGKSGKDTIRLEQLERWIDKCGRPESRLDGFSVLRPIDFRRQNDAAGQLESDRPRTLVPMEPTKPLEDEIYRREIRDEKIGVDVHGLLDDLGGDQHAAVRSGTTNLPEVIHPDAFIFVAHELGETAVDQPEQESAIPAA